MSTRILLIGLLVILFSSARAQNSMGIGTESPNPNAVLELVSPTGDQGFLIPRLTTDQRTATAFTERLGAGEQGLMVFDIDEASFFFWSGTEWLSISNNTLALSNGAGINIDSEGVITNTGDLDNSNELNDPTGTRLSGTTLEIADAGGTIAIDLAPIQDGTGTDNQDLELNQNTLTLTNDGTSVDLSAFLDNTDSQDLFLSGNTLSLSNSQSDIDLSPFLDNTDSQSLGFDGSTLSISGGNSIDISNVDTDTKLTDTDIAGFGYIKDPADADADPQNEIQDLQLNSNVLTISGLANPTQINLASYSGTNTDEQTLALVGSNLSITGGNTIDISSVDTDTQLSDTDIAALGYIKDANDGDADNTNELQSISYDVGTNLLSLTSGGSVDLSDLQDSFTDTDDQTLSLAGTSLAISGGNSIDIGIIDTDTKLTDADIAGFGYIKNPTDGDADASNEIQTISYDGATNILSLTGGGTADLSDLQDNFTDTDEQTLTLSGSNLSISGGNAIDISSIDTDTQLGDTDIAAFGYIKDPNDGDSDPANELISSATLTGSLLEITDAGGTSNVDLSSLLDNTDDQTAAQVSVTPESGISSNNVQAALVELQGEIASAGGGDMLQSFYDSNADGVVDAADDATTVSGLQVQTAVPLGAVFTDEQSLTLTGTDLAISGGNSIDLTSIDTDTKLTDAEIGAFGYIKDPADGDASNTNEIQSLSYDGVSNVLSLTDGGTVDLSDLQDSFTDTDDQELSLAGNTLSLTNDATPVDLSGYLDNTDAQSLAFDDVINELSLTNGGVVDLSSLAVDNVNDADADPSNEIQTISYDGATNVLSITGGGTADLSDLQDSFTDTDDQDLSLAGNTLSLTNDATPVDLSVYLDNTDAQILSYNDVSYALSLSNGGSVDLTSLATDNVNDADADPSNELISGAVLNGTNLEITDAGGTTSVDISTVNSDNQNLGFTAGQISLSGDPDNTVIDISNYDGDVSDDITLGTPQSFSSTSSLIDLTNSDGDVANFVRSSGTAGTTLRASSTQNGGVAEFIKSGDNSLPILKLDDQSTGFAPAIEANRGIIIGDLTNGVVAGAMRWSGTNFEGFDGSAWVSFTGTGSTSASNVTVSPTANLTSTDAQAALEELQGDIDGLGTAAQLDAGTTPGNLVQLDGSGRLPAVDGSLLSGTSPWVDTGTELFYNSAQPVGIGGIQPFNAFSVDGIEDGSTGSSGVFIDIANRSKITGTLSGIRFKSINIATNDYFNAGIFYDGSSLFLGSKKSNDPVNFSTANAALEILESRNVSFNRNVLVSNRLGVGTTTPSTELDVVGDAEISGNLGVGTSAPSAKLDVVGDVEVNGTLTLNGPLVSADAGATLVSGTQTYMNTPSTRLMKVSAIASGNGIIGLQPGQDGQEVIIVNTGSISVLIIAAFATIGDNNDNLILASGSSFTLGRYDTITLIYIQQDGGWLEVSRSQNIVGQF